MEIKICKSIDKIDADVLVIPKFVGKKTKISLVDEFAPETFKGKEKELFEIHTQGKLSAKRIIAVGLGKEKELTETIVYNSIISVVKKCLELKAKSIAFAIEGYEKTIILATSIINYHFDKYKNKKDHRFEVIYLLNADKKQVELAQNIADAMKLSRNLSNEPAAFATPSKLAQIAESIEGVKTKIYDKAKIEEMKMGAYLAVSQGSAQEPKFIHIKYSPKNPKKKIAIIGKGLCFDSGGMDIKPASSMLTMRDDMSGAACVLGIMKVISKLKPKVEVNAIIAACENMPSGTAYKPGDILTAKNGKTIEVDNTDAEGRLTLADALCYACELKVDEVIDIATLTGACMVALGTVASGIMGNSDELIKNLIKSGENSHEKYWELPMWQEYRNNLNSDIADMKNTGTRHGGASAAGMFLKEFVTDDVKWAHLDVAGTAFLENARNEFSKGATGVGVRTLIDYIMSVK